MYAAETFTDMRKVVLHRGRSDESIESAIETVNFIIASVGKILELGNSWYKPSTEWKQFLQTVHHLRERLDFLVREVSDLSPSSSRWIFLNFVYDRLLPHLVDVRHRLELQRHKLENIHATSSTSCDHHLAILFQAKVGLRVDGTIDDLENFLDEYRYVPLKDSEDKIYAALNNRNGPQVILFHGGAGKGKSTVARNTIVHYTGRTQFDQLIFLNCGPHVRVEETEFELLQRLGYQCFSYHPSHEGTRSIAIHKQIKRLLDPGSKPFAHIQDDDNDRSELIRKEVKGVLSERNVLLVLDDVRDGEFVRRIVELCGPGVKCLITSEQGSLCQILDHTKLALIEIQDIDQNDARRIFATHSELPNGLIPPHLKSIADRMIDETDFNPLAIATLANVIDANGSHELKEWEEASNHIFLALGSEAPPALLSGNYPRSLWATIGLSINTLNEDARNLLLLAHACEGPSVPKEVIQVLYTSLKLQGESTSFSGARRDLEKRQLISLSSVRSAGLGMQTTWVVHSLSKRYIEVEVRDARDHFISVSLALGSTPFPNPNSNPGQSCDSCEGSNHLSTAFGLPSVGNVDSQAQSEVAVVTALCALYLEKHLAEKAAAKMGFQLEVFNKLKRNAIEPVTRLLALSVSDSWTEFARDCARKVFLSYVCSGALESVSVAHLLTNPTGAFAMSTALVQMAIIEEKTVQLTGSCPQIVMQALVDNLDLGWINLDLNSNRGNLMIGSKRVALEVIARFADNHLNDVVLLSFPRALDRIILSIPPIPCHALWELRRCAPKPPVDRRFDRKIPELPDEEYHAAYILNKLAFGVDEIKIKIASHPGALQGFARLLRRQHSSSGIAAHALMTLALADIDIIKECVKATATTPEESVIDGLVSLVKGVQCSLIRPDSSMFSFYYREREYFAMVALTVFDAIRGNQLTLRSGSAYGGRGYANFFLGSFEGALEDLTKAHEIEPEDSTFMRHLRTLRAKVNDLQGALALADKAISVQESDELAFDLQERGVLKIMMMDFHGALEDLNKGLELTNDDYEMLKHRGHVKFLLGDTVGAREDGDRAFKIQPRSVNHRLYRSFAACLGAESVEYLGLKLT